MFRNRCIQSVISRVLLLIFLIVQIQVANAGMISTSDLLAESADDLIQHSASTRLQQQQRVIAALSELGITQEQAAQRVAALNDSELHSLSTQLEQLPAGGDILGTVVFVFLVLLVTDILGFTDIFPFVKKTVHGTK